MSELAKLLRLTHFGGRSSYAYLDDGTWQSRQRKIIKKENHQFVYAKPISNKKGNTIMEYIPFNPCSIEDRLTIIKIHNLPFNAHERMAMHSRVVKIAEKKERREKDENSSTTI